MVKMFLKCDTTLYVYEHKCKTILCRVKVLTFIDNTTNINRSNPNTCRTITAEQWKDFDKELKSWLVLNDTNGSKIGDDLCYRISVKPNLKVKITKSKLITNNFLKCIKMEDEEEELKYDIRFPYVLDCVLEYTSVLPATSSVNPDEYEPLPTTSLYNNTSVSPLSYVPYTPSKRTRRFHSEYQVKTPGYELVRDTYSPKPIDKDASTANVARYSPAPIHKRSSSLESQMSNINEIIIESDDERYPYEEYRSIRTRQRARATKCKDFGEYIPQTQLIEITHIPAYKPTPIEGVVKKGREKEKKPENDEEPHQEQKDKAESLEKDKSEDNKSKDYKKKEKRKLKENAIENEKENKSSSKDTKSTTSSSKETKRSLNSTISSEEDIFETVNNLKDNRLTKNSEDASKTDKTLESCRKDTPLKSNTKLKTQSIFCADSDAGTNSRKHHTEDKVNKLKAKDKDKQKSQTCSGDETKSYKKETLATAADKQRQQLMVSPSSTRRSERSPSKPKRFIEDHEIYISRKKIKPEQISPFKNKELFGTDDDDEDEVAKCSNSNNNGSNKYSGFHTPKTDKRDTSQLTLSASPSSSTKKKRKRHDCEQEKVGMSKWLGKKGSSNGHTNPKSSSSKEKSSSSSASKEKSSSSSASKEKSSSSSSKEKSSSSSSREKSSSSSSKEKSSSSSSSKEKSSSSSSSKDKSSKKLKSSNREKKEHERCKSVSPQPMDIVMPSKEELEILRNKHKMQREENEKIKAALEKINIPIPKKVEQLSLKDLTLNELLDTFDEYRTDLDEIFEKNHKKNHVKGNDGINHCLVIGLIDQRIQLKMMEKLSDVYNTTNNTTHATLYANALLPEWIVRIFMKKYNFGRNEAINQIEDQDAYRSYIDDQNENSLLFED